MGRRERRRDGKPPKQLNPLKEAHAHCLESLSPSWVEDSFSNLTKPFIIDIGCGEGEWLVESSTAYDDYNYLGIEIRYEALLVAATKFGSEYVIINNRTCHNKRYDMPKNNNLGFIHANTLAGDLHTVLCDLRRRSCRVHVAAVQFPDPNWKGKHKKRRMLTQTFLRMVATHLAFGGIFYLQSDCIDVVSNVENMISSSYQAPDVIHGVKNVESMTALSPSISPTFKRSHCELCDVGSSDLNVSLSNEKNREDDDCVRNPTTVKPQCDHPRDVGDLCAAFEIKAYISRYGSYRLHYQNDQLSEALPECFTHIETERAKYVQRLNRETHHLLCGVTQSAFIKSTSVGLLAHKHGT